VGLGGALTAAALVAMAACASSGDVRRVETQVAVLRAESARQDSIHAAELTQLMAMQRGILDSLSATRNAMRSLRGEVGNDLTNVTQQMLQLQELTGQSQQRLTELRNQIETQRQQYQAPPADTSNRGASTAAAPSGAPAASADQMYEASLTQLRRGSSSTARSGLSELLKAYPTSERVPDALYFIGQSWAAENPDSARFYYTEVVRAHPQAPRAASALYNLGLLSERRKDKAGARTTYEQVVQKYPKSDEAALARDRLKSLGR
jgi:tol-pal system protein YbgF